MEAVSLLLGGTGLVLASVAVWSVRRLYREFSRVKREQYYLEQKVNALPRKIEQAIEALRIHTALLARGQQVSERLIRTGELYHEITSSEAVQLVTEVSHPQNFFLLDVRTHAEFAKRRIPGATLIPVEDLEKRYQTDIPAGIEKILVYCAGGERSRLACDFLSRQNYGNVYLLKNGLQEWPGPVEGDGTGTLIQISSKSKPSSHSSSPTSSPAQF
jgi:rhodanese-related sulfurtransferase